MGVVAGEERVGAGEAIGGVSAAWMLTALECRSTVLRTLVRYNRVQIGGVGLLPCAGAYAVVEARGTVCTGDREVLA